MNTKAFSLIELIIVIAVISIVSAIAFVAIDPARRIGEAKNDERRVETNSILKAIEKYSVDNMSLPPSIAGLNNEQPYMITSISSGEELYCLILETDIEEVVIGEELTDYLPVLPIDPDEKNHLAYGTGYYLTKKSDFAIQIKSCLYFDKNNTAPYQTSPDVPGPPTGLAYNSISTNYIHFYWTIPNDNGGAPIFDYIIEYKEDIEETWQVFHDGVNADTEVIVDNLNSSTLYNFRVAAVNATGRGDYSNIWSETTTTPGGSGGSEN